MKRNEHFRDKMNDKTELPSSDITDGSAKINLPDWNRLYSEMNVEDMPWYLPELDPDLKATLNEYHILSGSFLDVGTGPGTQAIGLSKLGFDVTGIDISEDAILKAMQLNDHVKFIQDDILNSQLPQQFNFIFDRGCFHIIDEDKRSVYISKVVKLLKKNGMLFLKCFSDKNTFTGFGPHHISRSAIDSLFCEQFDILQIKDTVYQSNSSQQNKTLFVVMKKKD